MAKKKSSRKPRVREVAAQAPLVEPPKVLATRPDEVIGHERALGILDGAMRHERVHHAWIFAGPAGVGKLTTAVAFGATLLDPTTGPDLTGRMLPEPGSPTQELVRAWSHPDLVVVRKELGKVSSDDAVRRQKQTSIAKKVVDEFLIEPATRTGAMGGEGAGARASKVFIVDEAELLGIQAQNALLKTLEEPPPGVVIVLVTAHEDRLLPTIRSRCQRVAFGPLSDAEMGAWIDRWTEREQVELESWVGEWLMTFGAGSPGAAVWALDNDMHEWESKLGPLVRGAGGGRFELDLGSSLAGLVEDRAKAHVAGNALASKEAANKEWGRRALWLVGEQLRRMLREGERPEARERAADMIDVVREAEEQLASNVNVMFVMENLSAQLADVGRGR